jgi:hypothetical protein
MSEPNSEESRDEDLSPGKKEEMQEFRGALKQHGSTLAASKAFKQRVMEKIRRDYPESASKAKKAVDRVHEERQRDETEPQR